VRYYLIKKTTIELDGKPLALAILCDITLKEVRRAILSEGMAIEMSYPKRDISATDRQKVSVSSEKVEGAGKKVVSAVTKFGERIKYL
jgi:hypothetical protein